MDSVKEVQVRADGSRLWFGFPHYVVLGWALLISWQLYELRAWRDGFVQANSSALATLTESVNRLQESVRATAEVTNKLQKDGIRTRTIVELEFPETARKVRNALSGLEEEE